MVEVKTVEVKMIEVKININSKTLEKLQKYIDRNNNELPEGGNLWTVEDAVTVLMLMRLDDEMENIG